VIFVLGDHLRAEATIRLAAFITVFAAMAAWEWLAPRRAWTLGRRPRWPSNLGVAAINTVLVRVLIPVSAVEVAGLAQARGWGLLNALAIPSAPAVAAAVIALDCAIYVQHVIFHAIPVLWRFHRMHHADLDFDTTTGIRFHPVEIVLSMLLKLGVVAALGPPAVAVLMFEVLLNATSMFNHGNVRIPAEFDRALRWILVTPDMHRVHHSSVVRETNSNFGFNLSWWDRLFGTYRPVPAAGHAGMTIGLVQFRAPEEERLIKMLTQPFRDPIGPYGIGAGKSGS
jgi:sterol desaturase/sphingolipid hydroxylase (fatty acid hydroxylase superfamily)